MIAENKNLSEVCEEIAFFVDKDHNHEFTLPIREKVSQEEVRRILENEGFILDGKFDRSKKNNVIMIYDRKCVKFMYSFLDGNDKEVIDFLKTGGKDVMNFILEFGFVVGNRVLKYQPFFDFMIYHWADCMTPKFENLDELTRKLIKICLGQEDEEIGDH